MKIIFMYCRRKPTLKQSKEFNTTIKSIINKTFQFGIAFNLFTQTAHAAGLDDAIKKANTIGSAFWKLLIVIGYWIIAFYGGKDILREITQGDTKDVIKVATKYGIGFAALVMFLQILDLIKSLS